MSRPASRRRTSRLTAAHVACALLGDTLWCAAARAEDPAERSPAPGGIAPAAQPPTPDDVRYEHEIDTALMEYERSNFQESREHFRRAHQLRPSARTLRGLGKVEFELRNYVEALQHLDAALATNEHALDGPLREEVEGLIARARGYVGTLHIALSPSAAALSVDGVVAGHGPNADLALMVGDHLLEFRAEGYLPERRPLRVYGGDEARMRIALARPPADRRDDDAPPRAGLSRGAWWGITLAVVVLAASSAALGVAISQRNEDTRELGGGSTGLVLVGR